MQVYRARLTQQYGGGEVAVKVQAARGPQVCGAGPSAHEAAGRLCPEIPPRHALGPITLLTRTPSQKGSKHHLQCYSCLLLQHNSLPAC